MTGVFQLTHRAVTLGNPDALYTPASPVPVQARKGFL